MAVAAAVATLAVTGWLGARELGRSPALGSAEVPSYWNEVPMTCETTEIELEHRKLETFRCDYEGAAAPPPGRYDHTETVWYSDIDGRRARQHDIVITPSGSVTGWAAY